MSEKFAAYSPGLDTPACVAPPRNIPHIPSLSRLGTGADSSPNFTANFSDAPLAVLKESSHLAVLIPVLDCAETLGPLLQETKTIVSDVLVVDDGSEDRSAEIAEAEGVMLLRQGQSQGKGAALRDGMQFLRQRGYSHAFTMDGDGEHLPSEIPRLLALWKESPEAIVIGARRVPKDTVAPIKLYGNGLANRWVERACGALLPDTQSGFRIYPIQAVADLHVRADRFAYETEVLIRAGRAGMMMKSVEVAVRYASQEERSSHFRPFWDTLRIIGVVLGLIFRVW